MYIRGSQGQGSERYYSSNMLYLYLYCAMPSLSTRSIVYVKNAESNPRADVVANYNAALDVGSGCKIAFAITVSWLNCCVAQSWVSTGSSLFQVSAGSYRLHGDSEALLLAAEGQVCVCVDVVLCLVSSSYLCVCVYVCVCVCVFVCLYV